MATLSTLPPLSLYIHIPWCEKKCPYCDFNSHVSNVIPEKQYIECLKQDLKNELIHVQARPIESIFIGGGTPSIFSAAGIKELLDACRYELDFSPDIEITMEANPGSSEQRKFVALRDAGVNRLSLGIQSFHQQHLQKLGRIHNANDAAIAIQSAKNAGFDRINIDLMHGLPGQTSAEAMADLEQAMSYDVSHLSWYQLTIEPNTEYYRYPPQLPVDDVLADIQDGGMEFLSRHGLEQYEISAFSRPEQQARHNLNYWQFGDYIAIGAGAHGKITHAGTADIFRYNKTRLPKDYMSRVGNFVAERQRIEINDILFECLMNCLRLNEGMKVSACLQRSFATPHQLQQRCQALVNEGLITIDDDIKATELGRRYLNTLLQRLLDA